MLSFLLSCIVLPMAQLVIQFLLSSYHLDLSYPLNCCFFWEIILVPNDRRMCCNIGVRVYPYYLYFALIEDNFVNPFYFTAI